MTTCIITNVRLPIRDTILVSGMTVGGVRLNGRISRKCIANMDLLKNHIKAQQSKHYAMVEAERLRVDKFNQEEHKKELMVRQARVHAIRNDRRPQSFYEARHWRPRPIPAPIIDIPIWALTEEARTFILRMKGE